MIWVSDAVPVSTRSMTREGFLRAGAVFTSPGVLEYDAAEMGVGPSGTRVRLRRTEESVFHPETIDSLRSAPITIGHPQDNVNPSNFQRLSVGSVLGEPQRDNSGKLSGHVVLSDAKALAAERSGSRQLSVKYRFGFKPTPDNDTGADFETVGPLEINHVALVQSGRAGPSVQLQDSAQEESMTNEEIAKMVREGITEAVKSVSKEGGSSGTFIQTELEKSLSPMMKEIAEVRLSLIHI